MCAALRVEIEQPREVLPVIEQIDGLPVALIVLAGGAVIGSGGKAVEIPMGGVPGVGIAVLIERAMFGRVDADMAQRLLIRGLSPEFLEQYSELVIEMKPTRR